MQLVILKETSFSTLKNHFSSILSLYELLKSEERDLDVIIKKKSAGEFTIKFSCNGNKFEMGYLTELMKEADLSSFVKVNE